MVRYTFCDKCNKVVDEFETECGWCKKEATDTKKPTDTKEQKCIDPTTGEGEHDWDDANHSVRVCLRCDEVSQFYG